MYYYLLFTGVYRHFVYAQTPQVADIYHIINWYLLLNDSSWWATLFVNPNNAVGTGQGKLFPDIVRINYAWLKTDMVTTLRSDVQRFLNAPA